jgi:hypothetical protein
MVASAEGCRCRAGDRARVGAAGHTEEPEAGGPVDEDERHVSLVASLLARPSQPATALLKTMPESKPAAVMASSLSCGEHTPRSTAGGSPR